MTELVMDAAAWKSDDDFYASFFEVVGAPDWHGRNFNALRDSIVAGRINKIEVPYRVVLRNYAKIDAGVKGLTDDFVDLLRELAREGMPVEVTITL